MSFVAVIPARYASTRLPGKPLEMIGDKPMIQHVWERSCSSQAQRVIVATDDQRIFERCTAFGAECLMTLESHPSGTDRLAEVAQLLGLDDDDVVVNVQGDEPLIPAAVINQVANNLRANPEASIATLCERISSVDTLRDHSAVKVVFDHRGMALYFSRACIPWPRDHDWTGNTMPAGRWYRHLGIYAYRVGFLGRYTAWEPSMLEMTESLEQLRALQAGEGIHVQEACEAVPGGVDTPEDLAALRAAFKSAGD